MSLFGKKKKELAKKLKPVSIEVPEEYTRAADALSRIIGKPKSKKK